MIAIESDDRRLRDALRQWNCSAHCIPAFIEKARFHRAKRSVLVIVDNALNHVLCPIETNENEKAVVN
jgi:hypothetical protein